MSISILCLRCCIFILSHFYSLQVHQVLLSQPEDWGIGSMGNESWMPTTMIMPFFNLPGHQEQLPPRIFPRGHDLLSSSERTRHHMKDKRICTSLASLASICGGDAINRLMRSTKWVDEEVLARNEPPFASSNAIKLCISRYITLNMSRREATNGWLGSKVKLPRRLATIWSRI